MPAEAKRDDDDPFIKGQIKQAEVRSLFFLLFFSDAMH
jgi:hypothetical protein